MSHGAIIDQRKARYYFAFRVAEATSGVIIPLPAKQFPLRGQQINNDREKRA